ncbi:MAG: hypothetical protein OJF49_002479 [Ktedonobacterales bacterium]|jgi:hypothetical protein|nr:MAG: hypothetical protein OJF49_002479 [Ktedonobacterales bacterium]
MPVDNPVDAAVDGLGTVWKLSSPIHQPCGWRRGQPGDDVEKLKHLSTSIHQRPPVIRAIHQRHPQSTACFHIVDNPYNSRIDATLHRQFLPVALVIPAIHTPYDDLLRFLSSSSIK